MIKKILFILGGFMLIIGSIYSYNLNNPILKTSYAFNSEDISVYTFVMTEKNELATIDTRTDKVVHLMQLDEWVTNPTLDMDGGFVYLTSGKPTLSPMGEYFIAYSIYDNRVIRKIRMPYPAPTDIAIVYTQNGDKNIFVTSRDYCKDFGSGITILSSDFNIINKYHLEESEEAIDYTLTSSINNDKLFALSTSMYPGKMGIITLRVISSTGKVISKSSIKGWWGGNDIVDTYEGKIYISTQAHQDTQEYIPIEERDKAYTTELLVYSNTDYKFLKTIPVSKIPRIMAYFPKQKKLFVEHNSGQGVSNEIEIIDTNTDTVVNTIKNIFPTGIYRVSEDKLYMVIHNPKEEGIKVWDVNQGKFTGFIPGGFFGGVSTYPVKSVIKNKSNPQEKTR